MKDVRALAALALLAACSTASRGGQSPDGDGQAADQAGQPCDPLAAGPLTLGTVVGAGKDAAGTLYVDSSNGIFVMPAGGGALIRQHVTGLGSSGTTEFLFTFQAPDSDASSARQLLVETTGNPPTATAMALGPTSSKAFLDQSPPGTTALTLVDSATVSSLSLVNTPNVISYLADVANGDVILATVPLNDDETSSDGGLGIFYGPPDAVAQRTVTAFVESMSGNGAVTFLVGDTSYVLTFGQVAGPDAGPFGTFDLLGLTPGSSPSLAVTLRAPTPATLPAGLSFSCLP